MSRLAAVEKGLYYPTPLRVIDMIARMVKPSESTSILDMCAGEGDAVHKLAEAWNLQAYGVELDHDRAAEANKKFVCQQGSYHQLQVEGEFDVCFLNPPYDYGERDGISYRQEIQFLDDSCKWLAPGGLLVFIPPRKILGMKAFQDLMSNRFRYMRCWAFPEPEVHAFDQVVVLAQRAGNYGYNVHRVDPENLEPLSLESAYEGGIQTYWHKKKITKFQVEGINPLEICPSWEEPTHAYASMQWDMLMGDKGKESSNPLVMPRPGHQALLLAAGALNGADLGDDVILKGGSEKITVDIEVEGQNKRIERETIVSRLSVLNTKTGEYETWRADTDRDKTVKWFDDHGETLAAAIKREHNPTFDGDLSPFDFSQLTAPGCLPGKNKPEFFPQQMEAAAACNVRWKDHKSVILSGEQGLGKTSTAIMATSLAGFTKTVVMCPSHLVKKWIRECNQVVGFECATTAKSISEVDSFFASDLRYLILSKETAKLGAKWRPAFHTKKVEFKELDQTYHHIYSYCPDCGAEQLGESGYYIPQTELAKKKSKCSKCGAQLWQTTPISDKGTKRWPLASYINKRYKRRYGLVLDEVHHYAGSNSDQSAAAQALCSGARKILGMTGTLYGGRASSVFYLLYKIEPSFRSTFKFDECAKFVSQHGLFENVIDEEERTTVYGYRRGGKKKGGKVKEIPGMSPAMIPMILPYTIFLKLKDLSYELPPYQEVVELVDHQPNIQYAAVHLQAALKAEILRNPKVLGAYLMACLGYPDCPEQGEKIYIENEEGDQELIATAPAFPRETQPKDQKVVDIALEEHKQGRKTLVFFTQTHKRDARMRVKEALEAEGLRVAVLGPNVSPDKREGWLKKAEKEGFDVLLTNGRLVETGLDLLWATTIIQYGIEYSINSLRQSTRRSWRLGQSQPVKVVYLAYRNTMQAIAMDLIARKMRAAELVDGDENGGLAQFDTGGADFLVELAQKVIAEGIASSKPSIRLGA